ncbi:MAG: nucleotide exchange factor GrpE [Actinomycetota bacterium]
MADSKQDRPLEAEQEPEPSKVQVRDRRKLRPDGESPDQLADSQAPPAPVSTGDPSVELAVEITRAKSEAAGYLDDLQRLKAEFDNYRKRVVKEQTALAETAALPMVARLLGVLDNFGLAVAAAEETKDFEKMLKGIEMVYGELKEVLQAEGIELIEAKGQPFDPHLHEAALEIPGDETGELVVAEILRPGYAFKGKVLRPSMVKVRRGS